MEVVIHRRAQIINAIAEMLEMLTAPVEESGFPIQIKFQSRNRDTFNFKGERGTERRSVFLCFNLVIEILLISRLDPVYVPTDRVKFQSRNRDTFNFKPRVQALPR